MDMIRTEFHIKQDLFPAMNIELDLNLDSMQRIELIAKVEELLNIHLSDDVASQFLTLGDLLRAVDVDVAEAEIVASGTSGTRSPWQRILSEPNIDDPAGRYAPRSSNLTSWLYFVVLRIVHLSAKLLFKLEVNGLENLPEQGPYLICPNHQSYLDGILILSTLPYRVVRSVFSVGKSPYFEGHRKLIARLAQIIPIDPDINLIRAMKISAIVLKTRAVLLIFPEGTRTYEGELQPFRKGAAILATQLGVPVLPVAIQGSFDAWSKTSNHIRLVPIKVTIGRLMYLDQVEASVNYEQQYARGTERIRDEVSELLGRYGRSNG